MDKTEEKKLEEQHRPAVGFQVVWREFKKDKLAMFSLIFLTLLIAAVFIASFIIDVDEIMKVKLLGRFAEPGADGYILGADDAGRDIFGQLIIGAKNSLIIAICITIIAAVIGIVIGLITGYYAGKVDLAIMRIMDFIMILPSFMITIAIVSTLEKYSPIHIVILLSMFAWIGKARLIRSKTLTEARRDYVSASKTMGTSDFKIMFREVLPNLSSIIIVNLTLSLAGNMGAETGLSFLGYGLPPSTPSLGTLVSYARDPEILVDKWWIWLPAALFILVMMLGINYVGQALRRAADSRQRLG
ncbi:ABC transporter permease [Lysinibacillus sphaericus]|uniref:ABC transporter permease n=1 Tax=Lysinibacillus sphaericus TaxID=1421 RepID=A0A544UWY9_LYSSH|nr:ABC transporter permease [Lysinibacillus sp. SDF0037]TQR38366.1 ABC transporter permease [Lysinibacillus sp. SDF0037]